MGVKLKADGGRMIAPHTLPELFDHPAVKQVRYFHKIFNFEGADL
jgi:hypothetical protein